MDQRGRNRKRLRELCEEIKSRTDYRSFYGQYCREARVSGARFQSHCPIKSHAHTRQESQTLSVDLRRGLFHCFSRDEGGDAIRFYELMHNVSFPRAVEEIACSLGLNFDAAHQSHAARSIASIAAATESHERHDDEPRRDEPFSAARMRDVCEKFLSVCRHEDQTEGMSYLARRGIDARTMMRAGLAYFPRRAYRRVMRLMLDAFALEELQQSGLFSAQANLTFYRHRLLFPFYVEGQAIYLQGRTTASGVEPRWHNMRGGVPSLYNADALTELTTGEIVYLVEGFTDTLTLAAHGFTAVGIVGAGGFKEEWLAPLARFQVVAALDADAAGERATTRYNEMFAARGIELARLELASDVNDFFRNNPSASLEFALMTEASIEGMK